MGIDLYPGVPSLKKMGSHNLGQPGLIGISTPGYGHRFEEMKLKRIFFFITGLLGPSQ
jgi:hypothetical protein